MALVLLATTTACGARQVVDPTVAVGGGASPTASGSSTATGGSAPDVAVADAGGTPTGGTAAGGANIAAAAGTPAAGSSTAANPQGTAGATAAATGKTDVGVSRDTMLLGNVTSLSGPLPGQFDGMPNATQAFITRYNAQGGFRGRRLKLIIRDDGLDPNKHRAAIKQLVEEDKVFALINDGTVVHGASADYLKAKGVPVVSGSAFDNTYCVTPNFFSINVYCPHESGMSGWVKWAADHGVKRVAFLYVNLGITQSIALALKQAFKDYGIQLVFEREVQLAEADYTPYVLAARSANADVPFTLIDNASSINLLKAMTRQNWRVPMYLQAGQDESFVRKVKEQGLSLEGMVTQGGPLIGEPTEIEFNQTYKAAFPDQPINSFSRLGWIGMRWFTEIGLGRLGPDITRPALMRNLVNSTGFTAGGMIPPLKIGEKREPQGCGNLITVRNGRLARLHDGFLCAPLTKY